MAGLTPLQLRTSSPSEAARLSRGLLAACDRAVASGRSSPAFAAVQWVDGPARIVGSLQRATEPSGPDGLGSFEARSLPVVRRATSGSDVCLRGRSLWLSLALPSLTALAPDATPRTLLNRSVRGWLRGLRTLAGNATYLGREWLLVRGQPTALLGYEVARSGAVLVEAFIGWDEPLAPSAAHLRLEQGHDGRHRGKDVGALRGLVHRADCSDLWVVEALLAGVSDEAGFDAAELVCEPWPTDRAGLGGEHHDAPDGPATVATVDGSLTVQVLASLAVPMGRVEAGFTADGQPWLGGDFLAPTWVVQQVARTASAQGMAPFPLDGARIGDLEACAFALRGLRAPTARHGLPT